MIKLFLDNYVIVAIAAGVIIFALSYVPGFKEKFKAIAKKIWFYVRHVDGVWSVPIAFGVFYLVGLFLSFFFGYTTGFYDPSFIQPLFLASAVVIGITNFAVAGLYFTFRVLYRYIYGKKLDDGTYFNYSEDDFKKLDGWQKLLLSLSTFFLFFFSIVIIYLKLV